MFAAFAVPVVTLLPAVAPAVLEAHAALSVQSLTLGHAVARLEVVRASVPQPAASDRWRGAAHAAYGASLGVLADQLDEAIAAARLARHNTERALASLERHVG